LNSREAVLDEIYCEALFRPGQLVDKVTSTRQNDLLLRNEALFTLLMYGLYTMSLTEMKERRLN
jgi:hypothetical protein